MKLLKKIITIVAFGVFVSSCSDAYEITQKGELPKDETFLTTEDLHSFLLGIYGQVETSSSIYLSSVLTDELGIGLSNGGNGRNLHRFQFTINNGDAAATWYGNLSVINRCNRLLEGAEEILSSGYEFDESIDEEEQFYSIIAHTRALRAFALIQLQTYFSPDLSNPDALGAMFYEEVPETLDLTIHVPRSTNGVITSIIEADIEYAEEYLNPTVDSNIGIGGYKFVTPRFLDAIRARYYLYTANYDQAKFYAQKVLNSGLSLTVAGPFNPSAPGSFYSDGGNSPYRRMWHDTFQGEIIFALDRPSVGGWGDIAGTFYFNSSDVNGSPIFDMGRNLFNVLNNSGDIRRYAFVDPTSLIVTNFDAVVDPLAEDQIMIDKYPGKPQAPLRNDIKVIRLSEMYFILAECAIHEGDLTGAAQYIKNVRDARTITGAPSQPLPVYGDATEAWKDVLLERRRELCFEGHRYIDLKRLGALAGVSVDRHPYDMNPGDVSPENMELPVDDYRFTFPIPLNELLANPNMEQNPGY